MMSVIRLFADMKYQAFSILSRFGTFEGYARAVPAEVGFSVHCEKLYDDTIFTRLISFTRNFNTMTGKKLFVCVHTPHNPVTGFVMKNTGYFSGNFKET